MKGKCLLFLALGLNLVLAIHLTVIFFLARFAGGEVTIAVNDFSEQGVETILFPIFVLTGLVALIWLGRKIQMKKEI